METHNESVVMIDALHIVASITPVSRFVRCSIGVSRYKKGFINGLAQESVRGALPADLST